MPKKKDSIGDQIDKRFDQVDIKLNTLEEGQKLLLKMHFDLEAKMDKRFEEMSEKQDKILSAVSNLVVTVEGIKQDVSVISERVRQHEDKLESLSG